MALEPPVSDFLGFYDTSTDAAQDLLFYDVYTHVAELHLSDVGLDVQWYDVDVCSEDGENDRWGSSREYFTVPLYRLPIGKMEQIVVE